jgi:hypothetical protein
VRQVRERVALGGAALVGDGFVAAGEGDRLEGEEGNLLGIVERELDDYVKAFSTYLTGLCIPFELPGVITAQLSVQNACYPVQRLTDALKESIGRARDLVYRLPLKRWIYRFYVA